eukprot:scaffold25253_cov17-Tisochrysis_lutea.AAC.1
MLALGKLRSRASRYQSMWLQCWALPPITLSSLGTEPQKAVEQSSKVPEHVASVLGIAANDTGDAGLGTITEEGTEEPSEDPASQVSLRQKHCRGTN